MPYDQLTVQILARARRCAGSSPARDVLSTIVFWHPCMQWQRDGKFWVVKSREELADDAVVGLTALKVALKELEDDDLIERRSYVFNQKKLLYVRLTDRAIALIKPHPHKGVKVGYPTHGQDEAEPVKVGYPTHAKEVKVGYPTHAKVGYPTDLYKTENSSENKKTEDKKVAGPEGPAISAKNLSFKEFQEECVAKIGVEHESTGLSGIGTSKEQSASLKKVREQLTANQKTGLKASEVLPALANKPKVIPGTELGKLQQVWKQGLFDHHSQTVVQYGGKEQGNMKDFAANCPPGQAETILGHVIRHWSLFVEEALEDTGTKWKNSPKVPTTGFLVKYRQTAINWSLNCFEKDKQLKIDQAKLAEKTAEAKKQALTPKTESSVPAKPKQEKKIGTVEDAKEIFGDMWGG
jgi:hypothetical protein